MDAATTDWEMDEGQESEAETIDGEFTHFIPKSPSPPSPPLLKSTESFVWSPLPDKRGAAWASTPSDLGFESKTQPTVTSSIRRGLTNGSKTGLFQFFTQGTREKNKEYHARKTERSEAMIQDDQHRITAAKLQQAEIKKERARLRKRKERETKKRAEMQLSLRSPGGRKRRVSEVKTTGHNNQ